LPRFDDAGAGDQEQWLVEADLETAELHDADRAGSVAWATWAA
jgi:hypothetical protein